jgi:hypothetical protein
MSRYGVSRAPRITGHQARVALSAENVDEPAAIAVLLQASSDDTTYDSEKLSRASAELTKDWWSVVYGVTNDEWTPVLPDEPPKPRPKTAGSLGVGIAVEETTQIAEAL